MRHNGAQCFQAATAIDYFKFSRSVANLHVQCLYIQRELLFTGRYYITHTISIHSWFVFKVFATLMLVGVSYFYKYYDMLENYVQCSVMVYMYALRISFLPFQYVIDIEYSGVECSVYRSYFSHGNKENNYTLLVRKDNAKPVVLHFVGFDRLFGSHYDEYDIVYTDFVSSAPDPSVFDYQTSKYYRCTHSYVYDKPSICTCCKWFRLRS